MKIKALTIFIILGAVICLIYNKVEANDDYYTKIKDFLQENMKGEGFIPTPYGADTRFAPKSIWIYHNKIAKDKDRAQEIKAWVLLSSGRAIYTDDFSPVKKSKVKLPTDKTTLSNKLALTLSLTGNLPVASAELSTDFLKEKGIDIDINLGSSEIEYCEYFDMLLAQNANAHIVDQMNSILRMKFGKKIPPRRVIVSALRVKNASFNFKTKDNKIVNFDAGIDADKVKIVTNFAARLGLKWDKEKKVFRSLELDDWKYIAFQAIFTDETGKISSAKEIISEEFCNDNENWDFRSEFMKEDFNK